MAKFKKGDSVAQIIKPITGTVESFQVDQETGELLVLVSWSDYDGETHSRYFNENDIQLN